MKVIECGSVFLLFTAAGMYASAQLGRRKRQLKHLEKALLLLSREVDYHLAPLADAFSQTAHKTEKPWDQLFERMGKWLDSPEGCLLSAEEMLKQALKSTARYHPWKKDMEIMKSLGKGLGEMDKETQLARLEMTMEEVRQACQEAGEEQQQKEKLYQTLGVCMGILSVILMM